MTPCLQTHEIFRFSRGACPFPHIYVDIDKSYVMPTVSLVTEAIVSILKTEMTCELQELKGNKSTQFQITKDVAVIFSWLPKGCKSQNHPTYMNYLICMKILPDFPLLPWLWSSRSSFCWLSIWIWISNRFCMLIINCFICKYLMMMISI